MVDGASTITTCTAQSRAKTRRAVKRKRMEMAPSYLKGRVERDQALPQVEVGVEHKGKRYATVNSQPIDGSQGEEMGPWASSLRPSALNQPPIQPRGADP